MDRKFYYEKEYCNDIHNIDGALIRNALFEFCRRNFDEAEELPFKLSRTPEKYLAQPSFRKIIPIGSLEFVRNFMACEIGADFAMNPIEVPKPLRQYINRDYRIVPGKELTEEEKSGKYFLKDASVLKLWNNSLNIGRKITNEIIPEHLYVVSKAVQFESEWRMFVHEDSVLGIECYQGDPCVTPNGWTLQKMVEDYSVTEHPGAYTLDVGTRLAGSVHYFTEPLEVHPFVGVGLYGFYDPALLDMWDEGYEWYQKYNIGCKETK